MTRTDKGIRVLFVVKELEGAEPLGALYVAGCLSEAGHDVRFVGTRGNDVAREVARFAPDLVAAGATTGLHHYYLGLFASLKARWPKLETLLGGPHPTYFPEVIQSPGVDVICRGEGEDAAVELANAMASGGDTTRIEDLWVKRDGRIWANDARRLRRDLDSLPFPPRQLLYRYDDSLRRRPLKSFTTNRGCPFSCSYCFNPSMVEHYGPSWKKTRFRSPGNVVEEIARVKAAGRLHVVGFRESIFAYSSDWLREFGELYRREVGLPYYAHVRADMMTEEMVELMAWSGCHSVNLGIETANERLANEVLKRNIRFDKMTAGVRRLKAAGIVVFADNILGIPGGTFEDDIATLRLNIELDVDYAAATLCTPYPGTGIARYAERHGYFDGDFDAIDESYYTESVLRFGSDLDKQKVENLHKLFALTAALPSLLPLTERLVALPPNDFFYAAFRAWYVVSHVTDIMPRRPDLQQLAEVLGSIFGVYRGDDPNRFEVPEPEQLPVFHPGDDPVQVLLADMLGRQRSPEVPRVA